MWVYTGIVQGCTYVPIVGINLRYLYTELFVQTLAIEGLMRMSK